MITELGGRLPLIRLREIVEGLPRDEQELVSRGLPIGIVVDEHMTALRCQDRGTQSLIKLRPKQHAG